MYILNSTFIFLKLFCQNVYKHLKLVYNENVKLKRREVEILMQRLQLNADEEITRKEYLRRKKKKAKSLKKRSKITYFMFAFVTFLIIYIIVQFYVYKTNDFKYTADSDLEAQKVYNIYYVTEGYTYDPVYSLSSINSDGLNEESIYSNSGLFDINVTKDYIYGIKKDGIYRLSRQTNEFESIVEGDVLKYVLDEDYIYYITLESKLKSINISTKETKEFDISDVTELLVDDNNIFVVKDEKTMKKLCIY